jgi:hypothetical protein
MVNSLGQQTFQVRLLDETIKLAELLGGETLIEVEKRLRQIDSESPLQNIIETLAKFA